MRLHKTNLNDSTRYYSWQLRSLPLTDHRIGNDVGIIMYDANNEAIIASESAAFSANIQICMII